MLHAGERVHELLAALAPLLQRLLVLALQLFVQPALALALAGLSHRCR
jgi:hypothetical protein